MGKTDESTLTQLQDVYASRRENFLYLIETVFLSRKRTAEKLGFGQDSLISRYLKAKNIGSTLARKIEKAAGKELNWLDSPHLHISDRLRPYIAMEKPESGLKIYRNVPVISWKLAALWLGLGEAEKMAAVEEWLPCGVDASEQTFALRVTGISMEPRFREGEIIFVDPVVAPSHGKFVVVRLAEQEEAVLRQLVIEGGLQMLAALNPDWPVPVIKVDAETKLCGTVIFKGEQL